MKEEAKKLPPKNHNEVTPTKVQHDEILSTLLRINNFDSISSIKDESLDIDLSACVTISPAGLLNGNSLSSTDFWRVLDESAQNNELNLSIDKDDPNATITNLSGANNDNQHSSEFSVTFLRPDPPNAFTNSPFKRIAIAASTPSTSPLSAALASTSLRLLSPEQQQPRSKIKQAVVPPLQSTSCMSRNMHIFKVEPGEESEIQIFRNDNDIVTKLEIGNEELISTAEPVFSMFTQPKRMTSMAMAKRNTESSEDTRQRQEMHSDETGNLITPASPSNSVEAMAVFITVCHDCKEIVINGQEELERHEAAGHRIRLFYQCSECDQKFETEAAHKKHSKKHRAGERRKDTWKKCPDCGKCLKHGSMWMHRKIHSDNKKYGCDVCGQKFVQKINLTHHMRIHSSEKPYECPECQKRFQERSHLQRHQKYHAQTRSYRCEKCGKMYKTERCLKVHNLVHLEQRPFACNICDKSFISNSKLKQHSNIHTGMRPFKCKYCPRDFTNFPNWLKHTRRRHKVDHKTGEHLENIPSYCSKKSTSAKSQKAAAEAKEAKEAKNGATITTSLPSMNTATTTMLPQSGNVKQIVGMISTTQTRAPRKKKITQQQSQSQQQQQPQHQQQNHNKIPTFGQLPVTSTLHDMQNASTIDRQKHNASDQVTIPLKQPKVKRERKQLMPKQLQHVPTLPALKKESLNAAKSVTNNFLDMHCLSMTSAEELIMEQALEMEECGLFDATGVGTTHGGAADGGTDNAISSDAAALLRFQIKNELNDEFNREEEFITTALKKSDINRLACPSLESSPFSSPASIELTAAHPTSSTTTAASAVSPPAPTTTAFYMPSFSLNAQGAIVTSLNVMHDSNTLTITRNKAPPLSPALVATTLTTAALTLSTTSPPITTLTADPPSLQLAASNLNQTLLPMGVPLLVQANQTLPAVDTLLYSAHTGSRYFHGKTTAQHNLS